MSKSNQALLGFFIVSIILTLFTCCSLTSKLVKQKPESVILLSFNGYDPEEDMMFNDKYDSAGYSDSTQLVVLAQVAEYYKKFNVIVTRDEQYFYTFPLNKRYRAVISTTKVSDGWGGSFIGLAMYNQHLLGDTTAAYISARGETGDIKEIGMIIAHEVGHLIGLAHQATWDTTLGNTSRIATYNEGDSLTAPLMGHPKKTQKAVWVDGINENGDWQSDVAILRRQLGIKY